LSQQSGWRHTICSAIHTNSQATILSLFQELKERFAPTYLFISHHLGIIHLRCNRVTMMYLGTIVERGPTQAIFAAPAHPYTQALLAAVLKPEVRAWEDTLLQGEPPRPDVLPSGCRFRRRCPFARQAPCARLEPRLTAVTPSHSVACHLAPGVGHEGV
jgi:oligopeptide/dipeptide ABC transporter ATP-binding protein